jgi:hypothetical protein
LWPRVTHGVNINMEDQITVVDLARIKTIIETACSRGAFQAAEMKAVGEVYDRLAAFLGSVMSQAQSNIETNQGETQ